MFGLGGSDDETFDEQGAFVPENIPDAGPFLKGHDVLTGRDHIELHAHAREAFEQYGVYDATFGYNLARLNLDRRHPDAGLRYAWDADNPCNLRVEFTPTTPFCPQSESLTRGTFRALTATADHATYESVQVRVHPMHHTADDINDALKQGEEQYAETGSLDSVPRGSHTSQKQGARGNATNGDEIDAPF